MENLENKMWYRFLKVIFITFIFLVVAATLLVWWSFGWQEPKFFVITLVIEGVILNIIANAGLYIFRGKK